jgi:hypothetical protein
VHLLNDLPLRLHRESDDDGLWEHRLDMLRRPNAIYLRHVDIHHHQSCLDIFTPLQLPPYRCPLPQPLSYNHTPQ